MSSARSTLPESPHALTVRQYQALAGRTDRTATRSPHALDFPLLGLFGEAGSLLSELKKKQRDADSYIGYEASVVEELGDVLWYLACLASRAEIDLGSLAQAIACEILPKGGDNTFFALQPDQKVSGPQIPEKFEGTLIRLAAEVGTLIAEFREGAFSSDNKALMPHMSAIFRTLIEAANDAGVSLADAATNNLQKIFDRWPQDKVYPPLFDEVQDDPDERLPRIITFEIFEKVVNDEVYVFQRCNGIFVGDRLTDNRLEKDDYRFHDVFHMAYAAKLGWSPVLRALLRHKRKSTPEIDEAQDGARAILIEEGVSTWIFNHATKLNYFETLTSVDYGLLKAVRELVAGYEVATCPLWLWEEAILSGYEVFRALQQNRRGIVTANLDERSLTFKAMPT